MDVMAELDVTIGTQHVAQPAAGEATTVPLPRRSARRSAVLRRLLIVVDGVVLSVAMLAAIVLGHAGGRATQQILWAAPFVIVLLALFRLYGLYERDGKRLGHSTLDEIPQAFHALLLGTLGLWAYLKLVPADRLVLAQVVSFLVLAFAGALSARAVVRLAAARAMPPERVLVLGNGARAELLANRLRTCTDSRLEPVGIVPAPRRDAHGTRSTTVDLRAACDAADVDRVVIDVGAIDDDVAAELIRQANHACMKVSLFPTVLDVLGPSTEVDDLEGLTILSLNPVRFSRSARMMKRGLDIVFSGAALLATAWLLPFVALAIKLDSRGPVFFSQLRSGRGGRRFKVLKLRTMVFDAEAQAQALRARSVHPAWVQVERDPRITRVGRILRRTSLDEAPQLWNVLRGDMSLVGPRPMPLDTDAHITGWGRRRLDLTPGMTGLWQVLGRATIPFEEMIKLDYLYVTNWSLWGDVKLLLRTVFVVLNGRGAS
jgi:exopolysaccharide biosynthesis polyprenyl glycosylphosphotransferase